MRAGRYVRETERYVDRRRVIGVGLSAQSMQLSIRHHRLIVPELAMMRLVPSMNGRRRRQEWDVLSGISGW